MELQLDFGDYEEVHETSIGYENVDFKKEKLLKTIHLYELIDAIMERWEEDMY